MRSGGRRAIQMPILIATDAPTEEDICEFNVSIIFSVALLLLDNASLILSTRAVVLLMASPAPRAFNLPGWAIGELMPLLRTIEATLENTLVALVIQLPTSPATSHNLVGHDVVRSLLTEVARFLLALALKLSSLRDQCCWMPDEVLHQLHTHLFKVCHRAIAVLRQAINVLRSCLRLFCFGPDFLALEKLRDEQPWRFFAAVAILIQDILQNLVNLRRFHLVAIGINDGGLDVLLKEPFEASLFVIELPSTFAAYPQRIPHGLHRRVNAACQSAISTRSRP